MKKTILITGATDGIGLLAAKKLFAQGHKLVIHGRNQAKLEQVSAQLGGLTAYLADFSDMDSVVKMAKTVLSDYKRLDVLINNAGVLKTDQPKTASGRDIRFDVNTLAPFVLTRCLLPIIPETGRVLNLSSAAQAQVDIPSMKAFVPMDDMAAYAQSSRPNCNGSLALRICCHVVHCCLLYTSPSPRDRTRSRMPSSA